MRKILTKSLTLLILAVFLVSTSIICIRELPQKHTISVAEKVQSSSVRIEAYKNDILQHTGTGTILKIEPRSGKNVAIILTAAHLINEDCMDYTISYTSIYEGGLLDWDVLPVTHIIDYDPSIDLALLEVECSNGQFGEQGTKIYSGQKGNLFNTDVYVSSYVHSLGPVFSRGYINVTRVSNGSFEYIAFYGNVDSGSSGAAIRDVKNGHIIGVVSRLLGYDANKVLGQMNCIPFDIINKFLTKNHIKLD